MIVRASTRGLIDLTNFDPWDVWHWRRLNWAIKELETDERREVEKIKHSYWLSRARDWKRDAEYRDEALTTAKNSLNDILITVWPWLADQIGEAGAQTQRESLIAQYREMFGRPGEARYEEMIDETQQLFDKIRKQKPSMDARQAYQR